MDKRLFFAVWDLPELRDKIKSFMYPSKKTSNYYNYRNASIAAYYGYLSLFIERGDKLDYYSGAMKSAVQNSHLNAIRLHHNKTKECITWPMDWAARSGHLNVVKWLHDNRTEGCSAWAMNWAARNGHLDTVKWLHHNRTEGCTINIMNLAAYNGHSDIVQWLYHNKKEVCTSDEIAYAVRNGHLTLDNKSSTIKN